MAAYGRPTLRDLFDDAPTPHIAHPPDTHHRDFYLATDGSFSDSGGGLGAVIEARDGRCVTRVSRPYDPQDNNVAEFHALHLGLDVLATRTPPGSRVGLLLDHDQLAASVNASVLAARGSPLDEHRDPPVPDRTDLHWRGIRARLGGFADVRAARISSDRNPAHPLANTPKQYAHVNREREKCIRPRPTESAERIPPPSRSDRGAGD